MENGGIYDDSCVENVLIKKERIPCSSQGIDPPWVPSCSSLNASTSMMKIDGVRGDNGTENRFLTHSDSKLEDCNEEFDGCFHHTDKKRRLSPQQVQFLEKNFEIENKLEPERKAQLAKEVGLQPRQVAIWFQNRRARYKTKLLEKEYDSLKGSFDKLKADYEALQKQNEKMKNEINLLTEKMSSRDKGQLKQETYDDDPIRPTDLSPERTIFHQDAPAIASAKQDGGSSSAKSDVFDSYSPHYNEGHHSAYLEPTVDSSQVYEPEASDFSQQEDDNSPCRGLLPPSCFPKIELECHDDLQPNACNLGFPVQNQGTWCWQY